MKSFRCMLLLVVLSLSVTAQTLCPPEGSLSSDTRGQTATLKGIPRGITYYALPATGEDLQGLVEENNPIFPTTRSQLYMIVVVPTQPNSQPRNLSLQEKMKNAVNLRVPSAGFGFAISTDDKRDTCGVRTFSVPPEYVLSGGGILVGIPGEKLTHMIWKTNADGGHISAFDEPVKLVIVRVDKR
jgi:hypothetical protein